jgi:hypothetical protein
MQGFSLVRMLLDERPIKLANETEEAVWRFFLRRCGMKRLEARQILKLGHIQKYEAGDVIYDRELHGGQQWLCLVVEVRPTSDIKCARNCGIVLHLHLHQSPSSTPNSCRAGPS